MKIFYFHQYFTTPDGATGTRSYEFAKYLVEHGHDVTVICGSSEILKSGLSGEFREGKREGYVDGIRIMELDIAYPFRAGLVKRGLVFFRYAVRSISIALKGDYDLIFASSTPLTAALPGIAARLLRRKPFVFEVRDLWPELPREAGIVRNPIILKAMDLLEWISYRSANFCIGLSPGIVKGIVRRGVDPSRVVMIPNGCDLDLFTPDKTGAKRPEAAAEGDFLAVFSGAHGILNGLNAVLDAAAELHRRGRIDIKLLFIGDGKLKPELVHRAQTEKLKNCIFLDSVPKSELVNLHKGADIGMMILSNVPAFYYGTSPNKFFDYISSGLPVVNNYPGWLSDLIQENNCGIAVPPENPKAFADALEYLAGNRKMLHQMGKNARSLAEQMFDREKLAQNFLDVLESQMDDKPELMVQK